MSLSEESKRKYQRCPSQRAADVQAFTRFSRIFWLRVLSAPEHCLRLGKHMKPQIKLATARTPDGGEMELYQHDRDFLIKVNGQGLMNSRRHESEKELARLGCAHLSGREAPRVLIGGLGMGYTFRQSLAIGSSEPSKVFGQLLINCGFHVRRYKGKAHKDGNAKPLYIWVAAEDEAILPPSGGEPHLSSKKKPMGSRR